MSVWFVDIKLKMVHGVGFVAEAEEEKEINERASERNPRKRRDSNANE